jgi:hypothetical protein
MGLFLDSFMTGKPSLLPPPTTQFPVTNSVSFYFSHNHMLLPVCLQLCLLDWTVSYRNTIIWWEEPCPGHLCSSDVWHNAWNIVFAQQMLLCLGECLCSNVRGKQFDRRVKLLHDITEIPWNSHFGPERSLYTFITVIWVVQSIYLASSVIFILRSKHR